MINAIGAQFKNGVTNNKTQAQRVIPPMPYKKDSVSFSANMVSEKRALDILTEIFETPFEKVGSKFVTKNFFVLSSIKNMAEYYKACAETKRISVGAFDDIEDLGVFTKNAHMLTELNSLVFVGAEAPTLFIKQIAKFASRIGIIPTRTDKIPSNLISNGMKETLQKEFQKSDVIKTSFGKENFILKRELLDSSDPKSPMRYLSVERIEKAD